MTQECVEQKAECTRIGNDGECHEYAYACQRWENKCEGDLATVCVDFEESAIPNQCIKMELRCNKITKVDELCKKTSKQISARIQAIDQKLSLINEWHNLMDLLINKSVCSIKVRDDDRDKYTDCKDKKVTLADFTEQVELLDIFTLNEVNSIMNLREIVSGDSMVFQSDVTLYGDWSVGEDDASDTIIRRFLSPEEEQSRDDEYDLGVESTILITHTIDFNSVNNTAKGLSERVKQTICKEYGIDENDSARIQVILREFSLLEGNSTICPKYQETITPSVMSQEPEISSSELLYPPDVTFNEEDYEFETGLEYKSNVQSVTYTYTDDPKIVLVSFY